MKTAVTLAVLTIASFTLRAAESDEVLATFEGQPVLESQVMTTEIEKRLLDLYDAEYALKRQAVEQYVFDLLLKSQAEAEGITPEELFAREVVAKAGEPTIEQVMTTLQQNRSRLPKDNEQAKRIIERYLTERLIETRMTIWRNELLADVEFELHLEPVRYAISSLAGDAVLGAEDAPVTIVEFSDFQCPYCGESQKTLKSLEEKYGDSVRIVFKHLPLDIHPQARLAAETALCARDQGRFRETHDWLFRNPSAITLEAINTFATERGFDGDELTQCVSEKRYSAAVDEHLAQARDLGVESTPTFFVNGRKVSDRTEEEFSRLIDEELATLKSE